MLKKNKKNVDANAKRQYVVLKSWYGKNKTTKTPDYTALFKPNKYLTQYILNAVENESEPRFFLSLWDSDEVITLGIEPYREKEYEPPSMKTLFDDEDCE